MASPLSTERPDDWPLDMARWYLVDSKEAIACIGVENMIFSSQSSPFSSPALPDVAGTTLIC
jgi:hypothetical protein